MTLPDDLASQERLLDRFAQSAEMKVIAMIGTHRAEIQEMKRARFRTGYDLYGTESFHKTSYELRQDTLEELADAFAYQSIDQINQWFARGGVRLG